MTERVLTHDDVSGACVLRELTPYPVSASGDGSVVITPTTDPVTGQITYDLSVAPDTDTFGTVMAATAAGTSTNGVAYAIGDSITVFPDGTVWASQPGTVDTDTAGSVGPAPAPGTSTNGVAYAAGDQIVTFPDGSVWYVSQTIDTAGEVITATAPGTSSNSVPYAIGDQIIVFPGGTTWATPPGTIDTDTFGTVAPAAAAGTSTNGVAYAMGDSVVTFPDGTTWADPIVAAGNTSVQTPVAPAAGMSQRAISNHDDGNGTTVPIQETVTQFGCNADGSATITVEDGTTININAITEQQEVVIFGVVGVDDTTAVNTVLREYGPVAVDMPQCGGSVRIHMYNSWNMLNLFEGAAASAAEYSIDGGTTWLDFTNGGTDIIQRNQGVPGGDPSNQNVAEFSFGTEGVIALPAGANTIRTRYRLVTNTITSGSARINSGSLRVQKVSLICC